MLCPSRPDPLSPATDYRKSLEEVARLFAAGAVRVHTSHKFSLEEAPDAFRVLLGRQVSCLVGSWLVSVLVCSATQVQP